MTQQVQYDLDHNAPEEVREEILLELDSPEGREELRRDLLRGHKIEGVIQITAEYERLRQEYSDLLLKIACGDYNNREERKRLEVQARDLAPRIGRKFDDGLAYVQGLMRLVEDQFANDSERDRVRGRTSDLAIKLGKVFDGDLGIVRQRLGQKFGNA